MWSVSDTGHGSVAKYAVYRWNADIFEVALRVLFYCVPQDIGA